MNQYDTGLQKNDTQIEDCLSGFSYQLEPFLYPAVREVCSGYPSGYPPLAMPGSGVPGGTPGAWVSEPPATELISTYWLSSSTAQVITDFVCF